MTKSNGYNVPGYNVSELHSLSFIDVADRKQTSTVKVCGECIRVTDELKRFFELLLASDPVQANAAVHRYKMVRKYVDFKRDFVDGNLKWYDYKVLEKYKSFEYIEMILGENIEGTHYRVSISPHLEKGFSRGAIAIRLSPRVMGSTLKVYTKNAV